MPFVLDASHARALNAIDRGHAASPRLIAELAEAGLVTNGDGDAPTITPAGRAALKTSGPVDARGVLAAVRREPFNGLSFFYAGWLCGVLSFVTGIRLLIGVGGALLVAAGALAARRDDLLARQF